MHPSCQEVANRQNNPRRRRHVNDLRVGIEVSEPNPFSLTNGRQRQFSSPLSPRHDNKQAHPFHFSFVGGGGDLGAPLTLFMRAGNLHSQITFGLCKITRNRSALMQIIDALNSICG